MTKKVNPNGLRAFELLARLRVRYPQTSHAFAVEVGAHTGFNGRHADAIALGLWPSRGMELEGFEIKVSTSDWKKELETPEKAEAIAKFCQRWWVVAPIGVVDPASVPAAWGLLVEYRDGLKIAKAAPLNEDAKPLTRSFVAAVLRRFSETHVPKSLLDNERAAMEKRIAESAAREHRYTRENYTNLEERVAAFEKATGLRVDDWNLPATAAAIQALRDYQSQGGPLKRISMIRDAVAHLLSDVDAAAAALQGDEDEKPV